jgi:hypothetical protein
MPYLENGPPLTISNRYECIDFINNVSKYKWDYVLIIEGRATNNHSFWKLLAGPRPTLPHSVTIPYGHLPPQHHGRVTSGPWLVIVPCFQVPTVA